MNVTIATLEARFRYKDDRAAALQTPSSSREQTAEAELLEQLDDDLQVLGLNEIRSLTRTVVWKAEQMRCTWHVPSNSYSYHYLKYLMRVAWIKAPSSGLPIAQIQFRENDKDIPILKLPYSPPAPEQPARQKRKALSDPSPFTAADSGAILPLDGAGQVPAKRLRFVDTFPPSFHPLPNASQLPVAMPSEMPTSYTDFFQGSRVNTLLTQIERTDTRPVQTSSAQVTPAVPPTPSSTNSVTTGESQMPITPPPDVPNQSSDADDEDAEVQDLQLCDLALANGMVQDSAVLQDEVMSLTRSLVAETKARTAAERHASRLVKKLDVHNATSKREHKTADERERAWAIEKQQLLEQLADQRVAHEIVTLKLQVENTALRKLTEEVQKALACERDARLKAEGALRAERLRKESDHPTLTGISPSILPSLMNTIMFVAQLTDKVADTT